MRWLAFSVGLVAAFAGAAPAQEWREVTPGDGAVCAYGQDFVFFERAGDADSLLIYWHGGKACWTAEMCDPDHQWPMPDATSPRNDPRQLGGVFDLTRPDNPLAGWPMIFVPNCTGDLYLGNRERVYTRADGSSFTVHHRGRRNSQMIIDHAAASYPDAKRVLIAGGSAGGIAAPFFAGVAAGAFPNAEIVHLSDAAGGIGMDWHVEQFEIWGTYQDMPDWFDTETFGPDDTRFLDFYLATARAFPDIAFHQYDAAYDRAQTELHRYLGFSTPLYEELTRNHAELRAAIERFAYYTPAGRSHTVLRSPALYTISVNGVPLVDWIRRLSRGEPVETLDCGSFGSCDAEE